MACAVAAFAATIAAGGVNAHGAPAGKPALSVFVWQTPEQDFADGGTLSARTQRLDWQGASRRIGELEIAFGLSYDYTRFEYSGIASRNRDLHRLQVPITVRAERAGWRWRAVLAPGVATSSNVFKDILSRGTSEDVYATGAVAATRTAGRLSFSAGVASDRRFGRSQTYPLVALRGGNGAVRWQLGAPDAWLDWQPRESTTLGIGVAPAGMQWHAVRDDFQSDFDYRQRRWDARVFARQRIGERFFVSLHAGRGFDRRHRFEADTFAPVAGDVDDAWAFGIRFGLGNPTREAGYVEAW